MCSIIGYSGADDAAPILVKGLKRMEYRGYDSVGVATRTDGKISIKKGVGKVAEVNGNVGLDLLSGNVGIGHTRWATHGGVTDTNAHPHACNSGKIAIAHNGIIENFEQLKKELQQSQYSFKSETDTEVIVNLLQMNLDGARNVKEAVLKTVSALKGHYAFVAILDDGTLVAARFHEPLIIGVGKNSYFMSSDVLGFIEQTDDAIYIDNGSIVVIDKNGLDIFDFEGAPIEKEITKVSKEFGDAYKGDYAHFTLKEISEQPDTIIKAGEISTDAIMQAASMIKNAKSVYITGSGTSYNAALIARYIMLKFANVKVEPVNSSEFPHMPVPMDHDSILIAISQSGESADVLEAVSIAKKAGAKVVSIVNIITSSLAQESSAVIGMGCGPEIGVAATKSFTAQLAVLYRLTEGLCEKPIADFGRISAAISEMLQDHAIIQKIAKELKAISDIYVLGRGINYPMALEAALKIKELTYIHAEGISGGEIKHGPLALIESGVYVIIINPGDSTYSDTLISAEEIKARGAKIIGISDKKSSVYDHWIRIPTVDESVYSIIEVVPIQLLAYYAAVEKDTDPDYPRNLAKSVTVR